MMGLGIPRKSCAFIDCKPRSRTTVKSGLPSKLHTTMAYDAECSGNSIHPFCRVQFKSIININRNQVYRSLDDARNDGNETLDLDLPSKSESDAIRMFRWLPRKLKTSYLNETVITTNGIHMCVQTGFHGHIYVVLHLKYIFKLQLLFGSEIRKVVYFYFLIIPSAMMS
ncbi:hypothetical protein ANN_04632 [Periplaneta americana]|uniref:Uncharacterized protein n=1 Tax=Periplaneta americana TaxID=6978 RepID=A0ABQ8TAJ3_PERAM|nr:hypothetical protein ANN_04632 [Periplaneta americana]